MPVIKSGPFNLEYTDVGFGPVAILLHSSASGQRQWRRLVETLRSSYRLIAINLFGYGATSAWPGERPLSAADQAQLVASVATLVQTPFALIGHSLGGAVALEAAAELSHRVAVLVVFEPILFGYLQVHGPAAAYDEIADVARRYKTLARAANWNAVGELFIDYWTAPGAWSAMPEQRRQNTTAMLPPVVHEWDMASTGIRPLEDWRSIAAPVHLVHASDTRAPTGAIVQLLARTYPDWTLHEVPAGGHMAPLSRPDLVNPLIAAILERRLSQS